MIAAGSTLQNRYKIDKQIGQGGMGAVYVATDVRFGSTVAIKETLCMDANFRKAIEREARLLNSLKHSALPRVSDHFEESDSQFLVMEYIAGDDVASILERDQKPFAVEQVVSWANDLLDALDYLHNQDIPVIHRDIKPQNLKITPRGQIILLDFGLAKGNPTDAGHHTAAKSIFGYSRNYASLEQIQGTGTDPRSDLYSLAATLYHLITNVPPEDALTRAMAVLSQKPDPLRPANVVNPAVPAGIAGVLQKALDLNASERPASAAEMKHMLAESDQYADLATYVASDAPTVANVFAAPTRLMADTTRAAGGIKQTDVQTAVLSGESSEATVLSTGNTAAPPRRGMAFPMAIGAMAVLLVGAVIAGGIYIAESYGDERPATQALEAPVAAPAANVAEAPSPAAETQPQNAEPPAYASADTRPQQPADKQTRASSAPPEKQSTKVQVDDGVTVEMDNMDDPKDVVITRKMPDGTVKTFRVDPMMPPPNTHVRPPRRGDPLPPNFDWRIFTPEQRRKLQEAMRARQRPTPAPQPTRPEIKPEL